MSSYFPLIYADFTIIYALIEILVLLIAVDNKKGKI